MSLLSTPVTLLQHCSHSHCCCSWTHKYLSRKCRHVPAVESVVFSESGASPSCQHCHHHSDCLPVFARPGELCCVARNSLLLRLRLMCTTVVQCQRCTVRVCCTVSEMYSQSMLYATKTFILALAWAALCLPPLISRINRKIMPK